MSTTGTPDDVRRRRLKRLEEIAQYLGDEFPTHTIEPPCFPADVVAGRIRLDRGSQVAHEINFRLEFLDDRDDPVTVLKGWGLARHMQDAGSRPVWVGTKGLS